STEGKTWRDIRSGKNCHDRRAGRINLGSTAARAGPGATAWWRHAAPRRRDGGLWCHGHLEALPDLAAALACLSASSLVTLASYAAASPGTCGWGAPGAARGGRVPHAPAAAIAAGQRDRDEGESIPLHRNSSVGRHLRDK